MGQRPSVIAGETVVDPVEPAPGVTSRADRSAARRSRSSRARRRVLVVLAVAIAAAAGVASFVATRPAATGPATTGPAAPGPSAGLSLAFNPSFNGKKLDTSSWQTCYAWFNQAKGCTNFANAVHDAWYLPSGVRVSGGALHLVATKKATHGFTKSGAPKTYPYTSGIVTTKKSFEFTYGYVQIQAKISGGTGTWPALWLLPKSEGWPPEIDIMENFGSTRSIKTTVFWSASGHVGSAYKTPRSSSDLTSSYHTYGLLWKPHSLTWYLDGKVVDKYTGPYVPDQPMYLLANLAIDGKAASGSTFSIRSVQIYR
jgi:beta-glucanase (GH16 family)